MSKTLLSKAFYATGVDVNSDSLATFSLLNQKAKNFNYLSSFD
jgi:hypothetical protein